MMPCALLATVEQGLEARPHGVEVTQAVADRRLEVRQTVELSVVRRTPPEHLPEPLDSGASVLQPRIPASLGWDSSTVARANSLADGRQGVPVRPRGDGSEFLQLPRPVASICRCRGRDLAFEPTRRGRANAGPSFPGSALTLGAWGHVSRRSRGTGDRSGNVGSPRG